MVQWRVSTFWDVLHMCLFSKVSSICESNNWRAYIQIYKRVNLVMKYGLQSLSSIIYERSHTHTHTYIHTHEIYTRAQIHTYTCTHTHTHTYTHTHTHTPGMPGVRSSVPCIWPPIFRTHRFSFRIYLSYFRPYMSLFGMYSDPVTKWDPSWKQATLKCLS